MGSIPSGVRFIFCWICLKSVNVNSGLKCKFENLESENHCVIMYIAFKSPFHVSRTSVYLYRLLFRGAFEMYWSQPPLFPLRFLKTYLGWWYDYRKSAAITLYNKYFTYKCECIFLSLSTWLMASNKSLNIKPWRFFSKFIPITWCSWTF